MISFVMENTLFASFVRFRRANTFYFGGISLWHLPLFDSPTWPITDKVNREKIKEGKWNTFFFSFLIEETIESTIEKNKRGHSYWSWVLFYLRWHCIHIGVNWIASAYIPSSRQHVRDKIRSGTEAEQNSKSEDCVAAGLNNGFTRNFSLPM